MNCSRRNFVTVAVAGSLSLLLAGCSSEGGETGDVTDSDSPADAVDSEPAEVDSAAQSDYVVTIDGCQQGTDYEGNPCVILSFTFTNNSEEATSLATVASIEVYQDGVQRDMAFVSDVDTSGYTTKLKTGASTAVQLAYSVEGTSDIEVEVSELFSFDDVMLASQTFSLE